MLHAYHRGSIVAGGALALIAMAVLLLSIEASNTRSRTLYPPDPVNGVMAYDLNDAVPTSYGVVTETAAHLVTGDDQSTVTVALRVDNDRLLPIQAPSLDQLRMVTTDGLEAAYLDGGWTAVPIIGPRSSSTTELHFAAPPAGGMLILEYREPSAESPIRIVVGYALERNDAATSPTESLQ